MHGIKGESAICATNTLQFLTVPTNKRQEQNNTENIYQKNVFAWWTQSVKNKKSSYTARSNRCSEEDLTKT